MLPSIDDPGRLTPDARRRELAAILARGILRMHLARQREAEMPTPGPAEHAPDPSHKEVDVSGTTRPCET